MKAAGKATLVKAPREYRRPTFIPEADPKQAVAERWFAATNFQEITGPTVPSGPWTSVEALKQASGLTTEAGILSDSRDEAAMSKAARFHVLAAELRREAGEWALCVENFEALTRHYLARRDFKPALAYMRRLVFVADKSAPPEDRIDAHLLAAEVYREVRDHASAMASATRAAGLAASSRDFARLARVGDCVGGIHNAFATSHGDGSTCACGSPLTYDRCCQKADRPPAEFLVCATGLTSTPSRPAKSPFWAVPNAGIDVVLELPGPMGETPYWVAHGIVDGRHTLVTLPNWSARAMRTAKAMHAYAVDHQEGFEGPSSAILQVACSLDAFINAVIHFIGHEDGARFRSSKIPNQRFNKGTSKNGGGVDVRWTEIGGGLFGEEWLRRSRIDDLALMMRVRTALVHYKEDNIEQIAPPAPSPHALVAAFMAREDFRAPNAIRPGHMPWIDRLLTPHMAGWAVTLGEELIDDFRQTWHAAARDHEAACRIDEDNDRSHAAGE